MIVQYQYVQHGHDEALPAQDSVRGKVRQNVSQKPY